MNRKQGSAFTKLLEALRKQSLASDASNSELFARLPNDAARETLWCRFAPTAAEVAKRMHKHIHWVDIEDLFQIAMAGLWVAIPKHKDGAGNFGSFASRVMRAAICDSDDARRVPRHLRKEIRQIVRAHDRLVVEGCTCPSDAEIAREAGLTAKRTMKLLWLMRSGIFFHDSLDAQSENKSHYSKTLKYGGPGWTTHFEVDEMLVDLSESDRAILEMPGLGYKDEDILNRYGEFLNTANIKTHRSRLLRRLKTRFNPVV